ncbi:Ankyrin repeat family protein [Abeliophyllum distichum]|uniref:Ankyrin repeat family protein n=1 Tax=Abeliophyllum distichum TaxID=126358 RepID=A0ABD1TWU1_9LAMI
MDTALDLDINNLYDSINSNPDYLEGPNNQLFFQTPLHIAASEGHTRLALEILRLKPSLGKKLNPDGLCPLDLALRNGHTATVKGLIRYDPNLIRVQGREGITPLHHVVEMENIELLIRFLLECPSSIKDLTVRYETAVHIAVRKQKFRAFKVMKLLTKLVDLNAKNLEGKTSSDILLDLRSGNATNFSMGARDYAFSSVLEDTLSSSTSMYDMCIKFGAYMHLGLSGDMRSAFLVIIALIATATYQAALAPPSAFSNGQNTFVSAIFPNTTSVNATTYILPNSTNIENKTQITNFTIVNTICFASEGHTRLALEILRLKPSLGKKLNLDGLSPLDLALRNGHTATVKGLIRYDLNLIRVQGREGITPLHHVVEMENIELLIRFLLECPSSIKDLTVRYETAVRIAVRKQKFTAFKVMELLTSMVDFKAKNSEGKTSLDILPIDLRSGNARTFLKGELYDSCSSVLSCLSVLEDTPPPCVYLSSPTPEVSEMTIKFGAYLHLGLSGDMRNAFLVIVALVATATYQAALAPPSAFSNAQITSVNAIFPNTTSFNATTYMLSNSTNIDNKTQITEFSIVNTICFGMAMGTSFVLTLQPVLYAFLDGPLILFLVAYTFLTHGVLNTGSTISAMLVAFLVPISLVIPWWTIVIKKHLLTKGSGDYSHDEVKYLIYSNKYASRRSQEEGAVSIILPFFRK